MPAMITGSSWSFGVAMSNPVTLKDLSPLRKRKVTWQERLEMAAWCVSIIAVSVVTIVAVTVGLWCLL